MADGLRSKADTAKDAANFNKELATMIDSVLNQQRVFIEEQFTKFENRLDKIHKEVSTNSKAIAKTDHISHHVTRVEETFREKCSSMEATLAKHEDRSCRDNLRIISLPEKVKKSDPLDFISSSIPKWFPVLAEEKFEVMRAQRISPESNTRPPAHLYG